MGGAPSRGAEIKVKVKEQQAVAGSPSRGASAALRRGRGGPQLAIPSASHLGGPAPKPDGNPYSAACRPGEAEKRLSVVGGPRASGGRRSRRFPSFPRVREGLHLAILLLEASAGVSERHRHSSSPAAVRPGPRRSPRCLSSLPEGEVRPLAIPLSERHRSPSSVAARPEPRRHLRRRPRHRLSSPSPRLCCRRRRCCCA